MGNLGEHVTFDLPACGDAKVALGETSNQKPEPPNRLGILEPILPLATYPSRRDSPAERRTTAPSTSHPSVIEALEPSQFAGPRPLSVGQTPQV